MGFGDIFGGGGADVKFVDTRTKGQKKVGERLSKFLLGGTGIGQGLPGFKGQRVAGINQFEQGSLGLLGQMLRGGISPAFGEAEGALSGLLTGEPSTEITGETTQSLFDEIYKQSFQSLQEDLLPQIEGSFAGDFFSSARTQATTEAVTGFGDDMTSLLAELLYSDEQTRIGLAESAADRQLGAVGAAGQLGTQKQAAQTGLIQAGQQFGALPRILEQARLDASYNEWIRTRPEYNPLLDKALGFLGTKGLDAIVDPGSESILGGLISALGTIGGAALLGPGGGGGGGQLFGEVTQLGRG